MLNNKSYQEITDTVISMLQNGKELAPWHAPWLGNWTVLSHATGRPYSAINQLLVGCQLLIGKSSMDMKSSMEMAKFHKINECNGRIRRGSHGYKVYFWTMLEKQEVNKDGETITKEIPFLKKHIVFDIADVDGMSPKWLNKTKDPKTIADAETLISNYAKRENIHIVHTSSTKAFYSVTKDFINVPSIEKFMDSRLYLSTLAHEAVHSSGHYRRLNRFRPNEKTTEFGSEDYSREELIAELGSAFFLNKMGIDNKRTIKDSASYIKSWINALRNDVSLLPIAASKAERAVEFILGEKP